MSAFNLNCFVYGDRISDMFNVNIERTKSVSALKEIIRNRKVKSTDANLDLFRAAIPYDDSVSDEKFFEDVENVCNLGKPLRNLKLSDVFHRIDPDESRLHVIVKVISGEQPPCFYNTNYIIFHCMSRHLETFLRVPI